MLIKRFALFFLFFMLFFKTPFFAQIDRHRDFQLWLNQSATHQLNKKTLFFLTSEIRFADMATKGFFVYLEPRFEFLYSSFLSFGPGYRQAFRFRQTEKKWFPEYIPLFDVFLKKKLKGWEFIDRNRFMYFFRPGFHHSWIYRNRLYAISPWEFGTMKMKPVFYDEVFFEQRRGFFENRFFVGGRLKFSDNVSSTLGFLLRHIKNANNEWLQHNVLYLFTNLTF